MRTILLILVLTTSMAFASLYHGFDRPSPTDKKCMLICDVGNTKNEQILDEIVREQVSKCRDTFPEGEPAIVHLVGLCTMRQVSVAANYFLQQAWARKLYFYGPAVVVGTGYDPTLGDEFAYWYNCDHTLGFSNIYFMRPQEYSYHDKTGVFPLIMAGDKQYNKPFFSTSPNHFEQGGSLTFKHCYFNSWSVPDSSMAIINVYPLPTAHMTVVIDTVTMDTISGTAIQTRNITSISIVDFICRECTPNGSEMIKIELNPASTGYLRVNYNQLDRVETDEPIALDSVAIRIGSAPSTLTYVDVQNNEATGYAKVVLYEMTPDHVKKRTDEKATLVECLVNECTGDEEKTLAAPNCALLHDECPKISNCFDSLELAIKSRLCKTITIRGSPDPFEVSQRHMKKKSVHSRKMKTVVGSAGVFGEDNNDKDI
jgi:hypothetical protein